MRNYSLKGKSLSTTSSGRKWTISYIATLGDNQLNPRVMILLMSTANGLLGGDEWVEVRATSCP
jgi:hypothetical protein